MVYFPWKNIMQLLSPGNYKAIVTHAHHNYYFGRADADLTSWVDTLFLLLSEVFKNVQKETILYIKKWDQSRAGSLEKT